MNVSAASFSCKCPTTADYFRRHTMGFANDFLPSRLSELEWLMKHVHFWYIKVRSTCWIEVQYLLSFALVCSPTTSKKSIYCFLAAKFTIMFTSYSCSLLQLKTMFIKARNRNLVWNTTTTTMNWQNLKSSVENFDPLFFVKIMLF